MITICSMTTSPPPAACGTDHLTGQAFSRLYRPTGWLAGPSATSTSTRGITLLLQPCNDSASPRPCRSAMVCGLAVVGRVACIGCTNGPPADDPACPPCEMRDANPWKCRGELLAGAERGVVRRFSSCGCSGRAGRPGPVAASSVSKRPSVRPSSTNSKCPAEWVLFAIVHPRVEESDATGRVYRSRRPGACSFSAPCEAAAIARRSAGQHDARAGWGSTKRSAALGGAEKAPTRCVRTMLRCPPSPSPSSPAAGRSRPPRPAGSRPCART